jgi:putative ABC transport system permease protein
MKNNNQAIVRKIAKKGLAANHGRNVFIALAVFLTTFMLATIISVSVSYMDSLETYRIRLEGTTAHIGLLDIGDEQVEKLKGLDYIADYSTGFTVAETNGDYTNGNGALLVYLDETNWNVFRKPAFSDIVGEYPQNYDEIMVPAWILNNMGITEPKIGMDITVDYRIDNSPVQTRTFKLSGYFTSYIRLRAGGNEGLLVSREFAEASGHTVKEHGNVQIRYTNDKKVTEYNEMLARDLSIDVRDIYTIAKYNPSSDNSIDPLHITLAVFAVILLLVGYLLIYNTLSASVSRDVRFYGLLKTLGTTPKQIRKSIYIQTLYICGAAVPPGLLFSIFASLVFIPNLLRNMNADITRTGAVVSFNAAIYIGAAAFSVITALVGAMIPARKAARISPIEAVRFSEQSYTRKEMRSSSYKPLKAAWRNVFRIRKSAILVFSSLFLGMTMFMAVTTLLDSTSIDKMVESSMANVDGDIYLRNRKPQEAMFNRTVGDVDLQIFTPSFMKLLGTLPGLTAIVPRYIYPLKMDVGIKDMQDNVHYEIGQAFGLGKDEITQLSELSFDVDAFERGEFVLLKSTGEIPEIEVLFANAAKPVSLKVGGYLGGSFGSPPEIYISNTLLGEIVTEPIIHDISLYIEEASQREALAVVKSLTDGQPYIKRTSAFEVRTEFEV